MAQTHQVGKHATSIYTDSDGFTKVRYHNTPVVSFNHERVILNTGGWRTNTTKTRMNQTANQFSLGFQVFQKNFDWFARDDNGTIHEFNGNTLTLFKGAL